MLENIQYQHHEAYRYGHSSAIPKQKLAEQCISPMISMVMYVYVFMGQDPISIPPWKQKVDSTRKHWGTSCAEMKNLYDFLICETTSRIYGCAFGADLIWFYGERDDKPLKNWGWSWSVSRQSHASHPVTYLLDRHCEMPEHRPIMNRFGHCTPVATCTP